MAHPHGQHDTRRPGGKFRAGGVEPLRLTSMLDVCFLLLIFFVMTASFAVGEGILPADLPRGIDHVAVAPPPMPVEIALRSLGDDQVSIQLPDSRESVASVAELRSVLRARRLSPDNPNGIYGADEPLVIRPDGTVAWRHVIGVFDAATAADYTHVNFAPAR